MQRGRELRLQITLHPCHHVDSPREHVSTGITLGHEQKQSLVTFFVIDSTERQLLETDFHWRENDDRLGCVQAPVSYTHLTLPTKA